MDWAEIIQQLRALVEPGTFAGIIDYITHHLDLVMFAAAIILLLRGYPVAFTLAGIGLLFAIIGDVVADEDFANVGEWQFISAYYNRIFGLMDEVNEVLVAVPLFIFMGVMLERSQVAGELLETMGRLFGALRGGLGFAVTFVGMLLAASTGIVGATVVTMGLISLPSMLRYNYSKPLACGSIAASGTLGQIIPPSIVLVILGDAIANEYIAARDAVNQGLLEAAQARGDYTFFPDPIDPVSVGDIFAGAMIPGLILVGMYFLYQVFVAMLSPRSSPAMVDAGGEKATSLLLGLAVILGILALRGLQAASEAAFGAEAYVSIGLHGLLWPIYWLMDGIAAVPVEAWWRIINAILAVLLLRALLLDPKREKSISLQVLSVLIAPISLIIAVLGSILAGIAAPTEAAAVGAVGAILLAGARGSRFSTFFCLLAVFALINLLFLRAAFDLRTVRDVIGDSDQLAIDIAIGFAVLAAIGLFYAIAATFLQKDPSSGKRILVDVMQSTTKVTCMVFMILIGAQLFNLTFRGLGGEETVHELLSDLPGGPWGAMIAVMLVMFLLGFFLDFLEIVFVVVPIMAPTLFSFSIEQPDGTLEPFFHPVWVAVMIGVNLQTSFLTPPFGFALFYLRGVAPKEVSTLDIYKGVLPFVAIQILMLVILAALPILATWLPSIVFG